MSNITHETAAAAVKVAAEKLAAASSLPVQPSALDFHKLSLALREFAKASDFLSSLAIGSASVSSTKEFTDEEHLFVDALEGRDVFSSLNKAADEADGRYETPRSIFTGRRVFERVL